MILRDPVGVADQTVDHPGQPGSTWAEPGPWEQAGGPANWHRVGDAGPRACDLAEPATGRAGDDVVTTS